MRLRIPLIILASAVTMSFAACDDDDGDNGGIGGSGGDDTTGTGGRRNTGGSGGQVTTGGKAGAAGGTSVTTGGTAGSTSVTGGAGGKSSGGTGGLVAGTSGTGNVTSGGSAGATTMVGGTAGRTSTGGATNAGTAGTTGGSAGTGGFVSTGGAIVAGNAGFAGVGLGGAAGAAGTAGTAGVGGAVVLTDAQVFHVLEVLNSGEITQAQIAVTRGVDSDVRDFAQTMVTEHTAARQQGQTLASAQSVTPATNSVSQTLQSRSDAIVAQLNAATNSAFDRTYITSQIAAHQEALVLIDSTLLPSAQLGALDALVVDLRLHVAQHLDAARALEATLP